MYFAQSKPLLRYINLFKKKALITVQSQPCALKYTFTVSSLHFCLGKLLTKSHIVSMHSTTIQPVVFPLFYYRDIPYLDGLHQDIGYWSTVVCTPSVAEGENILENYLNNFRKLASLVVTESPSSIYSKSQAQSSLL